MRVSMYIILMRLAFACSDECETMDWPHLLQLRGVASHEAAVGTSEKGTSDLGEERDEELDAGQEEEPEEQVEEEPNVGIFGFAEPDILSEQKESSEDEPGEGPEELSVVGLEMVEIGLGACEEHGSLTELRKETQPELEACKAMCKSEERCSFISYKSEESSCVLFKGILCALDLADESTITYGKPEWLHDHWPYYPARCEIGQDSLSFKLFGMYACDSFSKGGGTLPFNDRYYCEDLVAYSKSRYEFEGCGPTGAEEGCPPGPDGTGLFPGGREYTEVDLKALLNHCPNSCQVCPQLGMQKGCKRSADCGDGLQCILMYDFNNEYRSMCATAAKCQDMNTAAGHPGEPCDTVEERQAPGYGATAAV